MRNKLVRVQKKGQLICVIQYFDVVFGAVLQRLQLRLAQGNEVLKETVVEDRKLEVLQILSLIKDDFVVELNGFEQIVDVRPFIEVDYEVVQLHGVKLNFCD